MSCGVGCRCSSDQALLWLWHRPAATAQIRPLAWEPLYAMGAALKRQKTKKKKIIWRVVNSHCLKFLHSFLNLQSDFSKIPTLYSPHTSRYHPTTTVNISNVSMNYKVLNPMVKSQFSFRIKFLQSSLKLAILIWLIIHFLISFSITPTILFLTLLQPSFLLLFKSIKHTPTP